jgi:hypothetical protein
MVALLVGMSTRALRRMAAPLLVVCGVALFGVGAGGIAQVDGRLEASATPVVVSQHQAPGAADMHRGVRTPCPQTHVEV